MSRTTDLTSPVPRWRAVVGALAVGWLCLSLVSFAVVAFFEAEALSQSKLSAVFVSVVVAPAAALAGVARSNRAPGQELRNAMGTVGLTWLIAAFLPMSLVAAVGPHEAVATTCVGVGTVLAAPRLLRFAHGAPAKVGTLSGLLAVVALGYFANRLPIRDALPLGTTGLRTAVHDDWLGGVFRFWLRATITPTQFQAYRETLGCSVPQPFELEPFGGPSWWSPPQNGTWITDPARGCSVRVLYTGTEVFGVLGCAR